MKPPRAWPCCNKQDHENTYRKGAEIAKERKEDFSKHPDAIFLCVPLRPLRLRGKSKFQKVNDPHDTHQKTTAARHEFLADLRAIFDSSAGVRVLAWLHATARTRKPAFLPAAGSGPIDPYAAAIADGRKAIVWEIEANLDAARALADADSGVPAARTRTGAGRKRR